MNKHYFFFLAMTFQIFGNAQSCDYTKEKYGFRVSKDILVGIAPDFQGRPDSLFVDIYYPTGVTEAKRPMIMWAFGGGFIGGKRQDLALVCEAFAKRGFVTATIDYRIGFHGIQILPTDSAEIIRAGYRGSQDGKSALRFLKARHVEDSIDLDRVWVGGFSAGSIVTLATAFFNKESEKPKEVGNITPANGNVRTDLGAIEGEGNLNGFDSKVQGVFNVFGAVIDLNIIESGDNIAVFSYHQTEDPVVPCGRRRPYWPYPPVSVLYPVANGSCVIDPRLSEIGLNNNYHKAWIYNGNQHDLHNQSEVFNFLLENANPILCNTVNTSNPSFSILNQVKIYPNPVFDYLFLEGVEVGTKYQVENIQGEKITSGTFNNDSSLKTEHYKPGIYFLQLHQGSAFRTIKFIKIN